MQINCPQLNGTANAVLQSGRRIFRVLCYFPILLFLVPRSGSAQLVADNYDFSAFSSTFSYINGTPLTAIQADDAVTSVNLPFTFKYNETDYNRVWVSSNGWMSFENPGTNSYSGNNLQSSGLRNVLAPLWDNLSGSLVIFGTSPSASFQTAGVAPNRILSVQWRNWKWNRNGSNVISFQIKLYEGTNVIEFCYQRETGAVSGGSASIGVSGQTGDFLALDNSGTNPSVSSTSENYIGAKPATGQVYQFAPAKSIVTFSPTHPDPGFIYLGSADNLIGCFKMDVNSKGDATASSITINTTGTYVPQTDIVQYKLYQNNQPGLTGATLLQTKSSLGTNPESLTFDSGFTTIPASSGTYYLITADVNSGGIIDHTVGFKAVSLSNIILTDPTVRKSGSISVTPLQTIVGATAFVSAVHPAAGIIYQNTINNMLAGYQIDAGSFADLSPSQFSFTTSGTYSGNSDISVFSLFANSSLSTTGAVLIASIATSGPPPQVLTFNFPSGHTISAGSTKYYFITVNVPSSGIDGRTVSVTATPLAEFVFSGQVKNLGTNPIPASNTKTIEGPRLLLTAIHPASTNIATGSTYNTIGVYQMDPSKVPGFVTPVSVSLNTSGTYGGTGDITVYSLFQNTANTLSGATFIGSVSAPASGGTISFSGNFDPVGNLQTQYLIVTCNVNPNGTVGKTTGIAAAQLSNFSFVGTGGLGVAVTGTNPAPAGKFHTIVAPTIAISTLHPVAGNMLKGSQDNMLAIYKMEVDYAYILPQKIILKTAGSAGAADIQHYDLFQNTSPSLSGATLVASLNGVNSGSTLTFTGNFDTISYKTPYNVSYLMLVCDVTGSATVNNKASIAAVNPIASNFSFKSSGNVAIIGSSLNASNTQNIVNKLDVYWSNGASSTKNWDNSTNNWGQNANGPYTNSVWLSNGYGFFEGRSGRVNVVSSPNNIVGDSLTFRISDYEIYASSTSNGITMVSPASITVNSGRASFGFTSNYNAIIQGVNGLVKRGPGELMISSNFKPAFLGNVIVNEGELTFGNKNTTGFEPDDILQGNGVEVVNATLTVAGASSTNIPMKRMTYMKFRGNSRLSLYQTSSSLSAWMRFWPTTGSGGPSAPTSVPTQLSGNLTLLSSGYTSGILGTTFAGNDGDLQNMIVTGSTVITGPLTLSGYASTNANLPSRNGTHLNFDIGGYGHYMTGVKNNTANGTIDDNGFPITFYGMGTGSNYAAELCFNATSSNLTGDLVIGDEAGANGGWVVTNTTTSLTRGNITVNKYSKLTLQLTSDVSNNITYSPKVISVAGIGPADQFYYPSALDFFNFSSANTVTSFSSDIVLNKVPSFDFASIGVGVAGVSPCPYSFKINGKITGTGGLEKIGPGNLMLNAQNVSNNYNTYEGGTTIKAGTITVNPGSNLGEGFLKLAQVRDAFYSYDTRLVLENQFQTVSGIQTEWTTTSGIDQTISLNGNGSGATLLVNQAVNTVFGNPTFGTSAGYIEGNKGNLIKDGIGTLELTGRNTYTGLTQVKGGTLKLNNTAAATLPSSNNVHIIGGRLEVAQNQTLNDLTLSTGELNVASGRRLTITGKFTLVPDASKITGAGTISYAASGELIYAGNELQPTTTKEIPTSTGPRTIRFNNFSTEGVVLSSDLNIQTEGSANGWVNFNGKKIIGPGIFNLYGFTGIQIIKGNTQSGSPIITNINTTGLEIGMRVSGSGVPDSATVIYIDPLVSRTITLNKNATATAVNAQLSIGYRGGLMVNLPAGIDAHVAVSGIKTYNPGANYKFLVPTTGNQIYPAFPTTGVLNFSPANDLYIMAGKQNRVVMATGQNLVVDNNFTLQAGIYVTNTNLITFNNTGRLMAPGDAAEGGAGSGSLYSDSYIAICDALGNPIINGASETNPYPGTQGFQIRNVGSTPVYFPVGSSYLPAGSGISIPAPNRMMIQNLGPLADFSVIVQHGDIGYTPGGNGALRVNRIWYVKSSGPDLKANMKLYFTKRNWASNNWPVRENEVEYGFNYGQTALVEKDYSGVSGGGFIRLSSGSDVKSWIGKTDDLSELYATYSIGISKDVDGNTNGIKDFYRFSIVNPGDIILPANIIASANREDEKVRVDWKSLNELNVAHYLIDRSANGIDFSVIGKLAASETMEAEKKYQFPDSKPLEGKNYYRVRSIDKDGKESFSNIALINMPSMGSQISLYPNPVTVSGSNLNFYSMPAQTYHVSLFSQNGVKLSDKKIEHPGGNGVYPLQLPKGLTSGNYNLLIIYGNEQKMIRFMYSR